MANFYVPKGEEDFLSPFGPTMGYKKLSKEFVDTLNTKMNDQLENEYNPVHIHTGCRLSCVGYLSLPEGIEDEWQEDYKDHHPSNGHIQFLSGTSSGYTSTNFMVKPQVGDFYVFPNQLFHCVYPFKTKGERRSFSVNMNFVEVPKDKKDAKK
jgi:hypothetical protein